MICHVCQSPDYEDENEIVFCSLCDISVHQQCYNIDKIPKDDWICQPCEEYGISGRMLQCPLCYCRGGAMLRSQLKISECQWAELNPEYFRIFQGKQLTEKYGKDKVQQQIQGTTNIEWYNAYKECYKFTEEELQNQPIDENVWFHNSCIIWNKKLDIKQNQVKGVDKLIKSKFDQNCQVCRTKEGYCSKCCHPSCNYSFHIECGKRANLHFNDFESDSGDYFCPEHTPLMVKKNIEKEQLKSRELIVKFLKSLKRFLKIFELHPLNTHDKQTEELLIQKELKQETQIPQLDYQELIKFFPQNEKQLFRTVQEHLKQRKDFQFTIKLTKNHESQYQVSDIKVPKKFIIKNQIDENALIWKKIQKDYKVSVKNLFNRFSALRQNLIFLHENQDKYVAEKEIIQGCTDEFVPNMDGFDDKQYCICKKEWKGETMLECFRCEEWFHPTCLNIELASDTQLNQIDFMCPPCEVNFKQNFGELDVKEQEDNQPLNVNKYYLTQPLDTILAQNKTKPQTYDSVIKQRLKRQVTKAKNRATVTQTTINTPEESQNLDLKQPVEVLDRTDIMIQQTLDSIVQIKQFTLT